MVTVGGSHTSSVTEYGGHVWVEFKDWYRFQRRGAIAVLPGWLTKVTGGGTGPFT